MFWKCCMRIEKIVFVWNIIWYLSTIFWRKKIQLPYKDTGSFALSVNTNDTGKNWENLNGLFDSLNLNKIQKQFNIENKNVLGEIKIETPIWIVEFICLRTKAYSFECNDKTQKKQESISKSQVQKFKFEED